MSGGDVFGIDLGTTNCACAYGIEGSMDVEDVSLSPGQRQLLPSVIHLEARKGALHAWVGEDAYLQRAQTGEDVDAVWIEHSKRFIGLPEARSRDWDVGGQKLDAIDAAALILRKIARETQETVGSVLETAVVTHPRDFTHARREATARAVAAAGIELVDTLNEPEAAFFMHADPGERHEPGVYMVFDLGGGTLDVALLEVPDEGRPRVIGGHGNPSLGGANWTSKMFEQLLRSAASYHGVPDYASEVDDYTLAQLRVLARDLKHQGSKRQYAKRFTSTFLDGQQAVTTLSVDGETWRKSCEPLVADCLETVERALQDASLTTADVTVVLPVGGSTRLKTVMGALEERFGSRLVGIRRTPYDVDLAVAQGAARYGSWVRSRSTSVAMMAADDETRLRVESARALAPVMSMAHGLNVKAWRTLTGGEEVAYLEPLVEKGAELPCTRRRAFSLNSVGATLAIELFEGPPGELVSGARPSTVLRFLDIDDFTVGDALTMVVEVSESGRIVARAIHDRTGTARDVTIDLGLGGEGDAPTDGRAARIAAIDVK